MSNIEQNLKDILEAQYGRDVRQSIHDGIRACYEDGKSGSIDLTAREQIAQLIKNEAPVDADAELTDIRIGSDAITYDSAGDAVRNQLLMANAATKVLYEKDYAVNGILGYTDTSGVFKTTRKPSDHGMNGVFEASRTVKIDFSGIKDSIKDSISNISYMYTYWFFKDSQWPLVGNDNTDFTTLHLFYKITCESEIHPDFELIFSMTSDWGPGSGYVSAAALTFKNDEWMHKELGNNEHGIVKLSSAYSRIMIAIRKGDFLKDPKPFSIEFFMIADDTYMEAHERKDYTGIPRFSLQSQKFYKALRSAAAEKLYFFHPMNIGTLNIEENNEVSITRKENYNEVKLKKTVQKSYAGAFWTVKDYNSNSYPFNVAIIVENTSDEDGLYDFLLSNKNTWNSDDGSVMAKRVFYGYIKAHETICVIATPNENNLTSIGETVFIVRDDSNNNYNLNKEITLRINTIPYRDDGAVDSNLFIKRSLTDFEQDTRLDVIEETLKGHKERYIASWGDSLTAGGGWTSTLQSLSGLTVYNGGTGGENSTTIIARQGADIMTINNITIPASGSVLIASRNTDNGISTEFGKKVTPLLQGGTSHVNPVKIGDIEGTLTWTGSAYNDNNGTWTFTRSEAGDPVLIDRPTAIRTAYDRNRNDPYLMVIFIGQNGGYSDLDDLVRQHRLMIEHANAEHVIILGLSSGTASQRADYEARMKKEFGRYFLSLREYLSTPIYSGNEIVSCYGMADQNVEIDPDYTYSGKTTKQEIEEGTVPHQILADGVHYTAETKTVIGKYIYKKCCELNIFPVPES